LNIQRNFMIGIIKSRVDITAAGASYCYGAGIGSYISDTTGLGSSKSQGCKIAIGDNDGLSAVTIEGFNQL